MNVASVSSAQNSSFSFCVVPAGTWGRKNSPLNMNTYGNTVFFIHHLPFHRRTKPSSPEEARMVPVIFQHTLHTVLRCSSNWATICTSNLVSPLWSVLSLKHEATQNLNKTHSYIQNLCISHTKWSLLHIVTNTKQYQVMTCSLNSQHTVWSEYKNWFNGDMT